jgi:hypothetical protein
MIFCLVVEMSLVQTDSGVYGIIPMTLLEEYCGLSETLISTEMAWVGDWDCTTLQSG